MPTFLNLLVLFLELSGRCGALSRRSCGNVTFGVDVGVLCVKRSVSRVTKKHEKTGEAQKRKVQCNNAYGKARTYSETRLFPLLKVNKSTFLWKLTKPQINWHHSWCHGDSIVQFKVVEERKRVWKVNCHQDAVKQNIKPKLPQQTPFGTLFMEIAKNPRVLGSFCMKTAEMCFSNIAPGLNVAMVTKGGRRRLKSICFENYAI